MLKKIWKGFSWIEIATALLLVSIVVGLTLPEFGRFKCLAKQSEAKFEVMRIVAAAQLFKTEHGHYPKLQELIDSGRVKMKQRHYDYEISAPTDNSNVYVLAIGRAGSQVEGDKWRVDARQNLEHLQEACK